MGTTHINYGTHGSIFRPLISGPSIALAVQLSPPGVHWPHGGWCWTSSQPLALVRLRGLLFRRPSLQFGPGLAGTIPRSRVNSSGGGGNAPIGLTTGAPRWMTIQQLRYRPSSLHHLWSRIRTSGDQYPAVVRRLSPSQSSGFPVRFAHVAASQKSHAVPFGCASFVQPTHGFQVWCVHSILL